jgi:hypothetical protein
VTPRWKSPQATLALAGALMLAVRLAIVATTPDVDTDSYGHFRAARALLADPANLNVHWVWLPGFHYLAWALLHVGVGFTGLRAVTALVQVGAPFLLYDLAARRGGEDPERSRRVALLAALVWTFAPTANRLATSAQTETWFALLVLACAWAIERRRAALAGALLAAACLFRYEAWGAIPALVLLRFVPRKAGEPPRTGALAFLIPAVAVAGWFLLRRVADGDWLVFFRETRSFASGVRAATGASPLLALALPAIVLGPAIVVMPRGLRPSLRAGWAVPGGVLAFLVASYLGRGALGLERYLNALVPFACVAIADGAVRLPERYSKITARAAARAVVVATALTAAAHLGLMVQQARAREGELRGYEAAVSRP